MKMTIEIEAKEQKQFVLALVKVLSDVSNGSWNGRGTAFEDNKQIYKVDWRTDNTLW